MAQMPFSPSPDDVTVGILGHIFGPIIDVLVKGLDPNTVSSASSLLWMLLWLRDSVCWGRRAGSVILDHLQEANGKR